MGRFHQGDRLSAAASRVPKPTAYDASDVKALAASCFRFKRNLVGVAEFGPPKLKKMGSKESEQERISNVKRRAQALQQKKARQQGGVHDPLKDLKLLLGV